MGTEKTRRQKIAWFEEFLNHAKSSNPEIILDKNALLAEFAITNFSTERTGEEILNLFKRIKRIKINGNEVTFTDE